MVKQAASPSTIDESTIPSLKDTDLDVVALSRARFFEQLIPYKQCLLAHFLEHQAATNTMDEEENGHQMEDIDLRAPEEDLDEDGINVEVDENTKDNDTHRKHENVATKGHLETTSQTAQDGMDTKNNTLQRNSSSELAKTSSLQLEKINSPDRKKRSRPEIQKNIVETSKPFPNIRIPPPRKVQRSSMPIRQYKAPIITTNNRFLSTHAASHSVEKSKQNSNDDSHESSSLVDLMRIQSQKSQQLQKAPSKKRQLPRLRDPSRQKCYWDILLDEMKWMATDFAEERQWKRAASWRLVRDACDAKTSEKRSQEQDQRKLARQVAVQISSYWRAMERIAARYQNRSSTSSFDRPSVRSLRSPTGSSPRHNNGDTQSIPFEWLRESENPEVRDLTMKIFENTRLTREKIKLNSSIKHEDQLSKFKLASFQLNALKFMLEMHDAGYNIILNDQLGTGKPYTVSHFLSVLDHLDPPCQPHLILVPDAEVHKWAHYIRSLHQQRRIQIYGGTPIERLKHQRAWDKEYMACIESEEPDVYCCICPMSIFLEEATSIFAPQLWQTIVVEDSAQVNESYGVFSMLQNNSSRVLVSENAVEHWTSDRMALWGEFILKRLISEWNISEWDELNLAEAASVQRLMKSAGLSFKDEATCLQIALRALTLGRLRNDVEAQLGKVEDQTVGCLMSSSQVKSYNNVISGFHNSADKDTLDHWLRFMLRLRSACNGVDVLHDFERLAVVDRAMLESCSGKLKTMIDLIDKLVHHDKIRVVVYSQCDMMLPVIEYAIMNHLNIPCVRVTGSTTNQHRALTHFAMKDMVRVAILSSRTRTVGTNRAACVYGAQAVIVLDSDWDPMCDAKLRAGWQLLATNMDVTVHRLYCENSIESSLLRVASTVSEKLFGEMSPLEFISSPLFKYDTCPSWWNSSTNNDMARLLMSAELLEKYCGNVENLEWYQLESPLTTGGELETEEHLLLSNSDELTPVEWYSVHLVQSLKEKQIPRSAPKIAKDEMDSDQSKSNYMSFESMVAERNRNTWKKLPTSLLFYDAKSAQRTNANTDPLSERESTLFGIYSPPTLYDGEMIHDKIENDPLCITYRAKKPPPAPIPEKPKATPDLKPIKLKKPKPTNKTTPVDGDGLKRKADGKKSTDYEGFPLPEASSGFDDDGFWGDTNLDALDSVSWDDTSILGGIQVQGLPEPPQKKLKTSTPSSVLQKPRKQIPDAAREGWSFVEEGLLKKLHDMYGANWNLIAQVLTRHAMVKRRSARQCQEKYQRLTTPNKDKPVKVKPLSLSPAAVMSRVGVHTGGVLLKYPTSTFGIPPPPLRKNWLLKQPVQDYDVRHFRSTTDAILATVKKKLPSPPIPVPTSIGPHESHADILASIVLSPDEIINKSKQLAAATYQAVAVASTIPPFAEPSGITNPGMNTSTLPTPPSENQTWGDMSLLHENLTRVGAESAASLPNGATLPTSALLYVIDRMPEIKNEIQLILHRNDCTESQKVNQIARLLSNTNHFPTNVSTTRPLVQSLHEPQSTAPQPPPQ